MSANGTTSANDEQKPDSAPSRKGGRGTIANVDLSIAAVQRIMEATIGEPDLGGSRGESLRIELNYICNWYQNHDLALTDMLPPNTVAKRLWAARNQAKQLAASLCSDNIGTLQREISFELEKAAAKVENAWAAGDRAQKKCSSEIDETFVTHHGGIERAIRGVLYLGTLCENAEMEAKKKVRGGRGGKRRKPDRAARYLFYELTATYSKTFERRIGLSKNNGEPSGPLLEFCKAVLCETKIKFSSASLRNRLKQAIISHKAEASTESMPK